MSSLAELSAISVNIPPKSDQEKTVLTAIAEILGSGPRSILKMMLEL